MFISVNKKILYSLLVFLFVLVGIFLMLFNTYYAQQLKDNRYMVYLRNKYVVQLLNDNVRLQNELADISDAYPEIAERYNKEAFSKNMDDTRLQLTREQQLNAELRHNYNANREALEAGMKIVALCLLLVILCIVLLIFLLNRWVIRPIERLTDISHNVSQGNYSSRIKLKSHSIGRDEFDILSETFNTMLEKTENNIKDIQEREKFLQQLIDAIPDGIRVIDKNYNVIMANKAFYSLLNIKQSCVGEKCYKAYGYGENECPQSKYNCPLRYLKKQDDFLRTIHEVNSKPLYINAANLRYSRSKTNDYIVEALHDLSGDVHFSHQQKVSSLAFLSTSVAHELKNSLGAVRMILEGLLENEYQNVDEKNPQKKYLTMAHQQLVEAVKTPERLLRLAQYSEDENAQINLNAIVRDIVVMTDYEAKRHGIEIVSDLEDELYISGNESDFKMIILNLIQNAIKAMPDGGVLKIDGQKKGASMVMNISDNGVGIDAEKIKHIFEPFYSGNSQAKSSGLGLAIVRNLMDKAKGKISVKSKVGKGSTFTLKIPLKKKITRRKKFR